MMRLEKTNEALEHKIKTGNNKVAIKLKEIEDPGKIKEKKTKLDAISIDVFVLACTAAVFLVCGIYIGKHF